MIGCYINLDDKDLNNNSIAFFKNGKSQGVAYQGRDVVKSVYFPAVSLYSKVCMDDDYDGEDDDFAMKMIRR